MFQRIIKQKGQQNARISTEPGRKSRRRPERATSHFRHVRVNESNRYVHAFGIAIDRVCFAFDPTVRNHVRNNSPQQQKMNFQLRRVIWSFVKSLNLNRLTKCIVAMPYIRVLKMKNRNRTWLDL